MDIFKNRETERRYEILLFRHLSCEETSRYYFRIILLCSQLHKALSNFLGLQQKQKPIHP